MSYNYYCIRTNSDWFSGAKLFVYYRSFYVLPYKRDVAAVALLTFTKLKLRNFLGEKAHPFYVVQTNWYAKSHSMRPQDFYIHIFLDKHKCFISKLFYKSFDDLQYWSLLHPGLSSMLYTQSLTHKMLVARKEISFRIIHKPEETIDAGIDETCWLCAGAKRSSSSICIDCTGK